MTVETLITFRDFVLFTVKKSLIRLIAFPLLLLFFYISKQLMDGNSEKDIFQSAFIWFLILFLFVIIRSFLRLRFTFNSNKKIQERICYTFTNEKVRTKGETFDTEFSWDTVYKVKENKDWFLIYHSMKTMNMIPKKYFIKEQILELRNIIKNNKVRSQLKNN